MTHDETVKLLALIKGNWFKQPTDDLTIRMWQEILGAELALADAWPAALGIIRATDRREDPPTPGELHRLAWAERCKRLVRENANLPRLGTEEPKRGYRPGERRVTPMGRVFVADEGGVLREQV